MKCSQCGVSAAQYELIGPPGKETCHRCTAAELERTKGQCAAMREALDDLMGKACEFIGPDEDNKPECVCCGMALETVSKGHRIDCLAQAILDCDYALKEDAGRDYISRESVKRQCSAMRATLQRFDDWLAGARSFNPGEMRKDISEALAADAGRDYISRESVKPLVDACKCWLIGDTPSAYGFPAETSEFICQCQARMKAALAAAKQLGFEV